MKYLLVAGLLIFLVGCTTECPDIELECPSVTCPDIEESSLSIDFINVGYGESQLIKYGDTEMLIDCGKNSMGPLVVDFLKAKGVKKLEYLMITHPDPEHLGGCDDILKSFTVQTVITNGVEDSGASYREVMDEIDSEQKIDAKIEDKWMIGPAEITILQTNNNLELPDENSLVSKLVYDDVSILFTGDCINGCEDLLLDSDLESDILKVAHHGTKFATEIDFLEKVNPSIAIIEIGDNIYGHPARETLDRLDQEGVQIYRTDIDGNIKINTDGQSYEIS